MCAHICTTTTLVLPHHNFAQRKFRNAIVSSLRSYRGFDPTGICEDGYQCRSTNTPSPFLLDWEPRYVCYQQWRTVGSRVAECHYCWWSSATEYSTDLIKCTRGLRWLLGPSVDHGNVFPSHNVCQSPVHWGNPYIRGGNDDVSTWWGARIRLVCMCTATATVNC